jgi:hypothetical protein
MGNEELAAVFGAIGTVMGMIIGFSPLRMMIQMMKDKKHDRVTEYFFIMAMLNGVLWGTAYYRDLDYFILILNATGTYHLQKLSIFLRLFLVFHLFFPLQFC